MTDLPPEPRVEDEEEEEEEHDDSSSKLRSFPRVKLLINPDYEFLLKALLENVEKANCAGVATGGNNSPWHVAFESTYSGVGAHFSRPAGKNRFHKFKIKVVNLWEAMEQRVRNGLQSPTHPLYRMAARQLETYRTVSMPVRTGKRGRPGKMERQAWLLRSRMESAAEARGSDDVCDGNVDDSRVESLDPLAALAANNPNVPRTANVIKTGLNEPGSSRLMAPDLTQSLNRLEATLMRSQPPVLPSPLHEMHQLKLRTLDPMEAGIIKPYYEDALGKHLSHVSAQAENSVQPQLLPGILLGLDALRTGETDAATYSSISYAYRNILTRYLELTNPNLQLVPPGPPVEPTPTAEAEAPPAKRVATETLLVQTAVGEMAIERTDIDDTVVETRAS